MEKTMEGKLIKTEFQLHNFEIYIRNLAGLYEMRFPENGSVLRMVFEEDNYSSLELIEREFVDRLYELMVTTIKLNNQKWKK